MWWARRSDVGRMCRVQPHPTYEHSPLSHSENWTFYAAMILPLFYPMIKKKWHDSTFYFLLRHHTFTELQRFPCPAFFLWFFETKLFTVKMAIRLKWGLSRWKFRANFSTVRLFVEYFDASWISYKLFHAFFVLADTWALLFFEHSNSDESWYFLRIYALVYFSWSGLRRWKFYHFFHSNQHWLCIHCVADGWKNRLTELTKKELLPSIPNLIFDALHVHFGKHFMIICAHL